jgi:hypothetical protein
MGALEYSLLAEALAKANAVHAWMIANRPEYAKSVADGQTLRWAIPYVSKLGWAINVKPRATAALTAPEVAALKTFDAVKP